MHDGQPRTRLLLLVQGSATQIEICDPANVLIRSLNRRPWTGIIKPTEIHTGRSDHYETEGGGEQITTFIVAQLMSNMKGMARADELFKEEYAPTS